MVLGFCSRCGVRVLFAVWCSGFVRGVVFGFCCGVVLGFCSRCGVRFRVWLASLALMSCLLPPPLALLPRLNLFGFRVYSNPWRGPGAISFFSKTTFTSSRREVREVSGRSERARDRAKFRPSAKYEGISLLAQRGDIY